MADGLGEYKPLVGVVLVGLVLRVFRLGAENLWLDEAYSVYFTQSMSLREVLFQLPLIDPHPPLYYALLDVWTSVFGFSEISVRFPSVLFGIATIVVVYLVGKELYDERTGLVASGITALSPFQIHFSQEARMYALFALLTGVSFYYFVQLRKTSSTTTAVGYVLSTVLLGYTHLFGLFVILAQNLYVLFVTVVDVDDHPPRFKRWVGLQVVLGASLVPWLAVLLHALVSKEHGGRNPVQWINPPVPRTLGGSLVSYISGGESFVVQALILVGIVSVVGLVATNRQVRFGRENPNGAARLAVVPAGGDWSAALLLGLWVSVPIAVPAVLSYLVTPIYIARYTIPASLGVFILLAVGIQRIQWRHLRVLLVVLLLLVMVHPLPAYYLADQKEQWQEATATIEANANADDLILVTDDYVRHPFEYYFDRPDVDVLPIPEETPADQLPELTSGHDTVWLVVSHANATDERRLVAAMNSSYTYASTDRYIGIDVYRYERSSEGPAETSTDVRRETGRLRPALRVQTSSNV